MIDGSSNTPSLRSITFASIFDFWDEFFSYFSILNDLFKLEFMETHKNNR